MSTQPEFGGERSDEQPADELDVYHRATKPQASVDPFLEENNLGLGYYKDDDEIWQQVERFHDGMFASATFAGKLKRRAIENTKRTLALEGRSFWSDREMDAVRVDGWHDLDEDERAETSRREFLVERGETIWQQMNNEQRVGAIEEIEGVSREWSPPHLRILMAQHEVSRSRDAHTQDSLFGRIEELVTRDGADGDDGGLLGGSR